MLHIRNYKKCGTKRKKVFLASEKDIDMYILIDQPLEMLQSMRYDCLMLEIRYIYYVCACIYTAYLYRHTYVFVISLKK